MFSLRLAAYLLVAPTLMGILIIALLTVDMASARYLSIAAIAGAVVGLPVAWVLASRLGHLVDGNRTTK